MTINNTIIIIITTDALEMILTFTSRPHAGLHHLPHHARIDYQQMAPMMPGALNAPQLPDQPNVNFPAGPGFFGFPPALQPAPVVPPPRVPLPAQPNLNLQELNERLRVMEQQLRQREIDRLRAQRRRRRPDPAPLPALPVTPPPQPNLQLQQLMDRQQARLRDLRVGRRREPGALPEFPPLPIRPEVRFGGVGDGGHPAGGATGVDRGVAFGGLDANRAVRNREVRNQRGGNGR